MKDFALEPKTARETYTTASATIHSMIASFTAHPATTRL